jgi:hypothetical protein
LAYTNGAVAVVANMGTEPVRVPWHVILSSDPREMHDGIIWPDQCAWLYKG